MNDPYGVPTGSVPRAPFRAEELKMHEILNNKPGGFTPKTADRTQIGGTHYSKLAIQPWDYVAANDLGYFEGSVVKYVTRWRDKGGVEDLKKARHFLDKLIEVSGG